MRHRLPDISAFRNALQKRRLGGAEMFSVYLKRRCFVSRQPSFAGTDFKTIEGLRDRESRNVRPLLHALDHALQRTPKPELRRCEAAWVRTRRQRALRSEKKMKRSGAAGSAVTTGRLTSASSRRCATLWKLPKLVQEGKEELRKGNAVVIVADGRRAHGQ